MKATLTKNIKVKTATAYLVFEKEQGRPDIVKYLNGEEFDDETINNRVKEYLSKLHILRNGSLTQKGEKIIKTGKLPVQEEGKYKIWFTENDNFLGTKILYIERIAPRDRERIDEINIDFLEENYFLPVNGNKFSNLKLVNTDNISGQINGNSENIELVWKWNNLESSNFNFSGKIDKSTIKENKIESVENLEEYILRIFPDWDYINQQLKFEFRNLTNENEKRKFKLNYQNNNQAGFDSIEFIDIPIMPYDNQDATKWRNWFIEQEIEKEYFLKYDFDKLVNEINNKTGFSAYKNNLDIPEISEYRESIYSKDRSKQSPAFWHLSAPNDLNPDAEQKYKKRIFVLKEKEQISMQDIVNKLTENTPNKINTVFYYDNYTSNKQQQKNLVTFFDAFNVENKQKHLITITNLRRQKRDTYLKNNSEINVYDASQIKILHDRYIILAENKNKYTIWTLTGSNDFIKYSQSTINPDTFGIISKGITFSRIEEKDKNVLREVLTFIENKL